MPSHSSACLALACFALLGQAESASARPELFNSLDEQASFERSSGELMPYSALNPLLRLPPDVEKVILSVLKAKCIAGISLAIFKSDLHFSYLYVTLTTVSRPIIPSSSREVGMAP